MEENCSILVVKFSQPYSREQKHVLFSDMSWIVTPPNTWNYIDTIYIISTSLIYTISYKK